MLRRTLAVGTVLAIGLSTVALASARPGRPVPPLTGTIDPSNFVRHVTNPFFPLRPGTLWVYRGVKDGKGQTDRVFVTHQTKVVLGIRATVVRDIAMRGGRLLEKTFDWYAQDRQGNVWYVGEDTTEFLPGGGTSTEGSWQAGVRGARPGIVMETDPQVADGYRQEFLSGHAEDQAWVLVRGGAIRVPYGLLHHVLRTMEWTPLEPNVIDRKAYVRGIGMVSETTAAGPLETAELVGFRLPGS